MANPYQAPLTRPEITPSARPSLLRVAFFLINFSLAVLFFIACVKGLIAPEMLVEAVGSVLFIVPAIGYAVCEWLAFYRGQRVIERRLGYANLALAASVTVMVITGVGEAMTKDDPLEMRSLVEAVLRDGTVVAYLTASGWHRVKWTTGNSGTSGAEI